MVVSTCTGRLPLINHDVVHIRWHHLGGTILIGSISRAFAKHIVDARRARRSQMHLLLSCKAIIGAQILKPLLQIVLSCHSIAWLLSHKLRCIILQVLKTKSEILDTIGDHHWVIGYCYRWHLLSMQR